MRLGLCGSTRTEQPPCTRSRRWRRTARQPCLGSQSSAGSSTTGPPPMADQGGQPGGGRKRGHHRKAASDTFAWAAGSILLQQPPLEGAFYPGPEAFHGQSRKGAALHGLGGPPATAADLLLQDDFWADLLHDNDEFTEEEACHPQSAGGSRRASAAGALGRGPSFGGSGQQPFNAAPGAFGSNSLGTNNGFAFQGLDGAPSGKVRRPPGFLTRGLCMCVCMLSSFVTLATLLVACHGAMWQQPDAAWLLGAACHVRPRHVLTLCRTSKCVRQALCVRVHTNAPCGLHGMLHHPPAQPLL